MLTEPLPATLDVRKAAARGATVDGSLKLLNLQRFNALLAGDEGAVDVRLAFSRDDEGRYVVRVQLEAEVTVLCQRCLEPMSLPIRSDSSLAIVFNDEQAVALPKHLEPLIVEEQTCNLWELAEDELILALPPFSYHDTATCSTGTRQFGDAADNESVDEDKTNPFDVLAQLKPGSDD